MEKEHSSTVLSSNRLECSVILFSVACSENFFSKCWLLVLKVSVFFYSSQHIKKWRGETAESPGTHHFDLAVLHFNFLVLGVGLVQHCLVYARMCWPG